MNTYWREFGKCGKLYKEINIVQNQPKKGTAHMVCIIPCVSFSLFFSVVQGFAFRSQLAWQAVHHLIHTPNPFHPLVVFSDRVLHFFAQGYLGHDPPTYSSHVAGTRCTPPQPSYFLRWGLTNFLPELSSNCNPPDRHLLSSWDYRWCHHGLP
jgi:hypothetical protein